MSSLHIGTPPCFQKPSGRMYLSSDQADLVSGNWTKVLFNAISSGFIDGIENLGLHCLEITVPGYYLLGASLEFKNVIADKEYHIEIRQNGNVMARSSGYNKTSAINLTLNCFHLFHAAVAQDFTLHALSEAGVDTVDIGALITSLWIQRVR